jgi:hypothetical protein
VLYGNVYFEFCFKNTLASQGGVTTVENSRSELTVLIWLIHKNPEKIWRFVNNFPKWIWQGLSQITLGEPGQNAWAGRKTTLLPDCT